MSKKQPCVYILSSQRNGTLYIGVTSHTKRYNIKKLVYYEFFETMEAAITREKQLKRWKRQWKMKLIEENNKLWKDLYDDLI